MGVTKSHSFFLFLRFLINRGEWMFSKFGTTEIEILEVKYVGEVKDKWEKIRCGGYPPTISTLVVAYATTVFVSGNTFQRVKSFPQFIGSTI